MDGAPAKVGFKSYNRDYSYGFTRSITTPWLGTSAE